MDPFSMGAISAGGDIVPDLSSSATGGYMGDNIRNIGPRTVINRGSGSVGVGGDDKQISPLMVVGGVLALGAVLWIGTRR